MSRWFNGWPSFGLRQPVQNNPQTGGHPVLRKKRLSFLERRNRVFPPQTLCDQIVAQQEHGRKTPYPFTCPIVEVAALIQLSYGLSQYAQQAPLKRGQTLPHDLLEIWWHHQAEGFLHQQAGQWQPVQHFRFASGVSGVLVASMTTPLRVLIVDGTNQSHEWWGNLTSSLDYYSRRRVLDAAQMVTAGCASLPADGGLLVAGHSKGGQDAILGLQFALLQLSHQDQQSGWPQLALLRFDPLANPDLEDNYQVGGCPLSIIQPRAAILTANPGVVSSLFPHGQVYAIAEPVGTQPPPVANLPQWLRYQHGMLRYTQAGGQLSREDSVETVLQGGRLKNGVQPVYEAPSPLAPLATGLSRGSSRIHHWLRKLSRRW